MKKIQMVDLQSQYTKIKPEIDKSIQEVLDTAAFVKGGKVTDFQNNLSTYLGVKHVIPVGNGTDALQIALMSLNLKPGDEVITTPFTFVATAEVGALLGLKVVFVDVDADTFNISVDAIENAITRKTKVIIPVHLFGQNADMEPLMNLAKKHNLHVIEDACQSIGSEYIFSDNSRIQSGCMGDIGCTSFFPSKNLGCYGDGGALFTNNDELAAKITSIANHGMTIRYHHDHIGVNSRLDSIQAGILNVKLQYLDEYIQARQAVATYYDNAFAKNKFLTIPVRAPYSTHVFHQYTLKIKNIDRADFQNYLKGKEIPAMVYYPIPLHLQKAYQKNIYKVGDFPNSEQLAASVISLPMHTELDEEQLDYICKNVLYFCK